MAWWGGAEMCEIKKTPHQELSGRGIRFGHGVYFLTKQLYCSMEDRICQILLVKNK